jgi:hypothetical protein
MADIIVETHLQKYITYCRIIRPRLAAPDPMVAQRQAVCGIMANVGTSPHSVYIYQSTYITITISPYFSYTFSKILPWV